MIRRKKSDSIPIDLIIEILSRLPGTSIARFRCVSKLWESIIHRSYLSELFLTRSQARPRLLFVIKRAGDGLRCYSSLQPQNPYEKSLSLVVAADFHTKVSGYRDYSCGYVSSLIYISSVVDEAVDVICNPTTGQYAMLPKLVLTKYRKSYRFLGFDPIDKQFKVLSIVSSDSDDRDHKILTLGNGATMWRKIQCPLNHKTLYPLVDSCICINGVLYYLALDIDVSNEEPSHVIICFDVRSEKFKFIDIERFYDPCRTTLINYKGKLGVIGWKDGVFLHMWLLEDVGKQVLSKYVYTFPKNKVFDDCAGVAGVTATGEIVLSSMVFRPFYVFYFNPERNTLQTVEVQGSGEYNEAFENVTSVKVFVDHVEDLNFIT